MLDVSSQWPLNNLITCKQLVEVSHCDFFADNSIGNEGVMVLCETLKTTKTLTKLELGCLFWKQENEIHKKQHKLDVWQWTGNGISDDGAVALGNVLKSRHASLTSINLYGLHQSRIILVWYLWIKDGLLHVFWIKTANKISECGVKALCDALAMNKKLKVLDIGGKVAWSLCPRLSGWKVMQWLWTKTGNAIGDESALVFAGMLRQNTTLEVLFLEGLFFVY